MAKKATKKTAEKITVADLAEEFGIEGRKIRMVIRGLGMNAPKVEGQEGFGPKAKYEWTKSDKDLKKIKAALKEAAAEAAAKPKKEKKSKKKSKKAVDPEPEDDEEEEDEEEEEEEEEDEEEEEEDE